MQSKHTSRVILPIALLCAGFGCRTTPRRSESEAAPVDVTILSLTPTAGSLVTRDTVVVVRLRYQIRDFRSDSRYMLAPLFQSSEGGGRTFNTLDMRQPDQSIPIGQPEGEAQFAYPIAREWDTEILAKPVVMCFAVFEMAGPNRFSILGTSEEVQYPTN